MSKFEEQTFPFIVAIIFMLIILAGCYKLFEVVLDYELKNRGVISESK